MIFISYSACFWFVISQECLILSLLLLWDTVVPHLWLKLDNYTSRLLRALKRQTHVPYNSTIVKIKVPEHWPLWEEHLPGIARKIDAKVSMCSVLASICNVKFVNKSQLSLTEPASSCSEHVY